MTQTYSLRKIPDKKIQTSIEEENNDKIKILELMNIIDEWEKEVLFADNGFFTLKGKKVENKTKEFVKELDDFISSKIYQVTFVEPESRQLVLELKKKKLQDIQSQLQSYEKLQMKEWETAVYENNIKYCIQRAVLYKNTSQVVASSYNNALEVLKLMSGREKWSKKTFLAKKELFESDFYFELINSFIMDKDVKASFYFEKYGDKILDEKKESISESIVVFKNNVLAFNWAKELFSYNLPDEKNEKEISSIEDKEIQKNIRHYFSSFKLEEKKLKEKEKKENNEQNWKEIISALETEPDKAELHIDFTLDNDSINAKKEYIKLIRKNGVIKTDKKKFLSVLEKFLSDFENYKLSDFSNAQKSLSKEDYDLLEKLKTISSCDYKLFSSDYNYVIFLLKKEKITDSEKIYDFLQLLWASIEKYLVCKKEEPNIEDRNKLIKATLERYLHK